jgi:hypothetical protein
MLPRTPILFLPLIGLLILASCSNPEDRFRKQINDRLSQINQGDYRDVPDWLLPAFRESVEAKYGDLRRLLFLQQRLDADSGRKYQLLNIQVFEAGRYAEVAFERSGPNGKFTGKEQILLPFVYLEDEWWIAGSFRSGEDLSYGLMR